MKTLEELRRKFRTDKGCLKKSQ